MGTNSKTNHRWGATWWVRLITYFKRQKRAKQRQADRRVKALIFGLAGVHAEREVAAAKQRLGI